MAKNAVKIQVTVEVPPGESCRYPPKDGNARGHCCPWALTHTGAKKRWCRFFDEADVSDFFKCEACLKLVQAASVE